MGTIARAPCSIRVHTSWSMEHERRADRRHGRWSVTDRGRRRQFECHRLQHLWEAVLGHVSWPVGVASVTIGRLSCPLAHAPSTRSVGVRAGTRMPAPRGNEEQQPPSSCSCGTTSEDPLNVRSRHRAWERLRAWCPPIFSISEYANQYRPSTPAPTARPAEANPARTNASPSPTVRACNTPYRLPDYPP